MMAAHRDTCTAAGLIKALRLKKHPEGGYFREVFRSDETIPKRVLPSRYSGGRRFATSIYYLLPAGEVSRFHVLKSDETWFFHTGCPLSVHSIAPDGTYTRTQLGRGRFQFTVRRGHCFGATVDATKGYSLVSCVVAPGFDFQDFSLVPRKRLVDLCGRKKIVLLLTK